MKLDVDAILRFQAIFDDVELQSTNDTEKLVIGVFRSKNLNSAFFGKLGTPRVIDESLDAIVDDIGGVMAAFGVRLSF